MESSGFFEAQFDSSIMNPETQEYGDWDRKYLAEQFAAYFSRFIGNGVFASPTNQLKVEAVGGVVFVNPGNAYIKGYWYNNSDQYRLTVPANNTSNVRNDSVVLVYSASDRTINIAYKQGSVDVIKGDSRYELQLAVISVPAVTSIITNAMITDKRMDETVCGIVKGLVEVIDTDDLFKQYDAIFNEWFDEVKGQISGDMAVQLTNKVAALETGKENTFTKNTAFNKNFGTTANTVCQGNDSRLSDARPASDVPSWAKQPNKPTYNKSEVGLGNVSNIGITFSDQEPLTVPADTIVFVYEE